MPDDKKVVLLVSIISSMTDYLLGYDSAVDDLEDALALLGLDYNKIAYELPPLLALQEICKELASINITDELLEKIEGLKLEDFQLAR